MTTQTTTRASIIEAIEADTVLWNSLERQERLDWMREYVKTFNNDGLKTIIDRWERHCEEASHDAPASQGGTATYASTHDKTGAICCWGGCDWFVSTR